MAGRTKSSAGDAEETIKDTDAGTGDAATVGATGPADPVPSGGDAAGVKADPVRAATAMAAAKTRSGSATTVVAPETVIVGKDPLDRLVAVSSAPNPSTSAEIQEASAGIITATDRRREFVGDDGKALSGDVFEDKLGGAGSVVYTTGRVYEVTRLPHSEKTTSVLVYAEGMPVERGAAEAFRTMLTESQKASSKA